LAKSIIIDMYAKAVQSMPAKEAVRWAHGELIEVYGA
jgi:multiple sugar transport system substrate-binding protein